jgi:hypothetical protein
LALADLDRSGAADYMGHLRIDSLELREQPLFLLTRIR